ncbi:hypothetical protein [Plantibacter sp. YIM 135347]|uniref:hypothetical protein n=1 Tax=Plantibacter sp. YIM 135347 TaxID=3423919 RepID=UPI003D344504
MGFLDRLLGRDLTPAPEPARSADEIAVERYERFLRTAPSGAIERAHVEAFEQLTPDQLAILFDRFSAHAETPAERPVDARPATLAKAATEAEATEPGVLKRLFGDGFGVPAAAIVGTSIFVILAGYVIVSLPASDVTGQGDGGAGDGGADRGSADHGDDTLDFSGDVSGFDFDF